MTQVAQLQALIARAPRLALKATPLLIHPPWEGWELGMVSWAAVSRGGVAYLLQRGHKADPIVAVDPQGRVLQSWGNGMFIMPHSIRIDPHGNIWTTDAARSRVLKFTPEGTPLLEIAVGGQPNPCVQNFCGTTDVAFAPNGHIFITDGYINARVIEYTADGKKVRQWGEPGTGPGQFNLVHSLQIDDDGVIYVADRENTRIQRFDLDGHFLGEWTHLGKTFSLTIRQGALYIATQLPGQPNFAPGWLMKLDRKTGQILGWIESTGNHGLEATDRGELLIGPGNGHAQWFR